MYVPLRIDGPANGFSDLVEDMLPGLVLDRVHGVKAKPVKVVLSQPEKSVVDEEVAHGTTAASVKIDGVAPRRVVSISKELRSIGPKIITLWPKVVIDHIQKDHQPFAVGCF